MQNIQGLVINCGTADWEFGDKAEGILIAIREPESFGDLSRAELVLRESDCQGIPALVKYFDALKDILDAGKRTIMPFTPFLQLAK